MASLVALTTFHANGRLISRGEVVESSDPIVAGREALFAPSDSPSSVEQATAAPGEVRAVRRPRKSAPKPKG